MRPVLIMETALADMQEFARRRYPCETGGILVGVKARRTVWIVAAIELPGASSSQHYESPPRRNAEGRAASTGTARSAHRVRRRVALTYR